MSQDTAVFYTIHVQGHLDVAWSPELHSLEIVAGQDGTTRLSGFLADQAALLGCLNRLVNLGANLLSVESDVVRTNKGKVNIMQHTLTMEVEETKILAQIEKVREGWNAGDGTLFGSPFMADADYTVWNGIYAQGRETIIGQHQHIFDTFYAGTTLNLEIQSIRFLRADVALVHLTGRITNPEGEMVGMAAVEGGQGTRPLMVMVKENSDWQIAAFQNTPIIQQTV